LKNYLKEKMPRDCPRGIKEMLQGEVAQLLSTNQDIADVAGISMLTMARREAAWYSFVRFSDLVH
jgi:hypothetical protein